MGKEATWNLVSYYPNWIAEKLAESFKWETNFRILKWLLTRRAFLQNMGFVLKLSDKQLYKNCFKRHEFYGFKVQCDSIYKHFPFNPKHTSFIFHKPSNSKASLTNRFSNRYSANNSKAIERKGANVLLSIKNHTNCCSNKSFLWDFLLFFM